MRVLLIISGVILLLIGAGLAVLSHPAFGLWRQVSKERIQSSTNYRDGMFRNQLPTPQFTGDTTSASGTLWHFLINKDTLRVPNTPIQTVKTDIKNLPTDYDWLVWFGHSSYLFCLNGKRFLVDPLLKPEFPASLMLKPFAGTDIYRPEDLPNIDVLIITHEHWDHMDYATLRDIRNQVTHVICPLGIADYLRYWGYKDEQIKEMDWYDNYQLSIVNHKLSNFSQLSTINFQLSIINYHHASQRDNHSNRLVNHLRNEYALCASCTVLQPFSWLHLSGEGECDGAHEDGLLPDAVVERLSVHLAS